MMRTICTVCLSFFIATIVQGQVRQKSLARVDQMADFPQPFQIIDYHKLAQKFDATVYNFKASGKYWPLIWIDSSGRNFKQPVAGIYTAIGDVRQGPANNNGIFHEAVATMGATLGATLIGINKQRDLNYVGMLKNYFNSETRWNIMMNNTCPEVALLGGGYGRDWWYDVYPNLLFYAICDKYPNEPGFTEIAKSIAEKFYGADSILNGNYDWSFFNYAEMRPMKNNICAQPDAAAGHAWVLYSAYKKFGDKRYLNGAISAMKALESQKINPTYELLMPFGAYVAARMNVEEGQHFDVDKLLGWTFDGTAVCREGWGVLTGNWNGIDISGIVGSTVDRGGYGFLMNTYDLAWPLIPLLRYDKSYANAIGKWMLNAANASRFFYPQYMPKDHQTLPELAAVTKGVIAYEGIIKKSTYKGAEHLMAPIAQGDGPLWVENKNPQETQFSVYGSGHVGIFGSIIQSTNVKGILRLDLLATDFFHDKAYPSYLYYNPHTDGKSVRVNVGNKKVDVYDAIAGKFLARNIKGNKKIRLVGRSSAMIVLVPADGIEKVENGKLLVNGVVVDYMK